MTADAVTFRDLARRAHEAKGPDPALDADVARALGWNEQAFTASAGPDSYSGSLDAVIRDVLPARSEWDAGLRNGYGYAWVRSAPSPAGRGRSGAEASHAAATPALAMLAAALEARAISAEPSFG